MKSISIECIPRTGVDWYGRLYRPWFMVTIRSKRLLRWFGFEPVECAPSVVSMSPRQWLRVIAMRIIRR